MAESVLRLEIRGLLEGVGPLPDVDTGRCTGCGWCVAACNLQLLSLEVVRWKKRSVLHQPARCTGCSACALKCPVHAITMRKHPAVG